MQKVVGNRYELLATIGRGGMGEVYRAYDRLSGQTVALKRVLIGMQELRFQSRSTDTDLRVALVREFQTLAGLRHPNIINVLDFGFDVQSQPYFTMSFLEDARSLRSAAASLDVQAQMQLVIQMLQALAYLHRRGIVHRDLKPGNVMVDTDGLVKVLDFGVAVPAEQSKEFLGTLEYIAPELYQGAMVTAASDLFAVGIMTYEMIVGHHPFDTADEHRLMRSVLMDDPDLEPIIARHSMGLARLINKLLAKDPAKRYRDAVEVIRDLSTVMEIAVPEESIAIRESFLQAARFVGRETELEMLRGALIRTFASQGEAWLIGGESGVGKTRLLDELRIYALVAGVNVLRGQDVEGNALPYQLWRDAVRRLAISTELTELDASILKSIIPDIGTLLGRDVVDAPPLTGRAGQERLSLSIAELFKDQKRPILLILEDLQWSVESLAVFKTLLRFVPDLPLLIVGSYRNDERPDLPEELEEVRLITLDRLSEEAIERLCTLMIGNAGHQADVLDFVKRETEGNTFFIVEVIRVLAEEAGGLSNIGKAPLPKEVFTGGVERIVQRRLEHIPDWGHEWLQLAAVGGRNLDLQVLGEVIPNLEEWLSICTFASVLEVNEERWQFAHDKLREKLLRDLPVDEQRVLHRRMAETIEQVYPDNIDRADILLGHWQKAGDTAKELHYTIPVCQRLTTVTAEYDRALELLGRGLELVAQDDYPKRFELLYLLSGANRLKGNYSAAQKQAAQSLTLAESLNNQAEIAKSLFNLGRIAEQKGEFAIAREHLERSLLIQESLDDRHELGLVLDRLGVVKSRQGHYDEAARDFERALNILAPIGDQLAICAVFNNLGVLSQSNGDNKLAQIYYEESLSISRQLGDLDGIGILLNNIGEIHEDLGEARRYFEESLEIFERIGDQRSMGHALQNLGEMALSRHDYPAAHEYYQKSLYIRRTISDYRGTTESLGALSVWGSLQHDEKSAVHYLREALRYNTQVGSVPLSLHLLTVSARLAYLRQDIARAARYCGLVAEHPSTEQMSRDELKKITPLLEKYMDKAELNGCYQVGGRADLAETLDQLKTWLNGTGVQ